MIHEEHVYCPACNRIVAREQAGQIFRTGYYKCSMRLGICEACLSPDVQEAAPCFDDSNDAYLATEPV